MTNNQQYKQYINTFKTSSSPVFLLTIASLEYLRHKMASTSHPQPQHVRYEKWTIVLLKKCLLHTDDFNVCYK